MQAKVSLIERRAAEQSLIAFTEQTFSRYRTAKHHRLVAEQLERVERREVDRLMLLLPPRHGKTELASRRYPPWNLGRNPHRQIIAASATEQFATDVGREVRNIVRTEEFQNVFPNVSLAPDSTAAGRWHTNHGGIFAAVGVGSQILGKGADDFVIDDPFATMEDAQSEISRKRVIEWYQGSVYNRLQPGGTIIVINHRMHEEDLSGYLIERQNFDGDKWEIVELKAIGEDGEALWPEAYPIEALERIRANTLPRFWSSLYQQNPQPDEGTFFQRDWLKEWERKPASLNVYGTSDYAVTEGDGDYTVHRVWGVDADGTIYRLDGWRGQETADVWIDRQLDLVKVHKPLAWFGESGPIRRAVEPFLKRRMRERKTFCRLEWLASIHDKPTRARAFQARAALGKVRMELGADVAEFLAFPAGRHDDEVDAASLIGRALDMAHPAIVAAKQADKPRDRWDKAFSKEAEDTWRVK
ncbi:MAG TPA: terminase family protein [Nitrobacter sp.]|nr:terminase family protein [Nitrobacter sp.]